MRWKEKLTKAELKHLKETSAMTLKSFKKNVAAHEADRALGKVEPCWTCKVIARKLGLIA